MSTPAISGLAGLVQGFTKERDQITREELDKRTAQRDLMVQYLGHLATNPNVPPEHQQWALGKVQELIQADPTKKLPKVDMGELPPVSVPGYNRQQQSQAPAMTLTPPVGPGGGATPAAPAPSSDVGRASDSTVNALGAASIQPPTPPAGYSGPMPVADVRVGSPGPANVPGSVVGGVDSKGRPTLIPNPAEQPNFAVAPPSPVTLPAGAPTTIQNPVAPVPISKGGQLHILTPSDKEAYAASAQGQEVERLRQQYPDKSPEDLAYFAKHGEFPKDEYSLSPGEKRFKNGKEVAANTGKKPGAKTGYSTKRGPSGEPMIVDNETGAELTPQEVEQIPEAKTLMATAAAAHEKELQDAKDKEDRHFQNQLDLQEKALNNALTKTDYQTAKKEVAKADEDYDAAVNRMKVMDSNIQDAKNGDQQAMISLLTNHIGMTLGAQKGARISQTILNEAEQSAPWIGRVEARFDKNGLLSGVVLTPEQMDSMVKLAHEKADTLRDHANTMRDRYQDELHTGGVKSKSKEHVGQIYTPPPGAEHAINPTNGHEIVVDGGKWVDAKTGQPIQ